MFVCFQVQSEIQYQEPYPAIVLDHGRLAGAMYGPTANTYFTFGSGGAFLWDRLGGNHKIMKYGAFHEDVNAAALSPDRTKLAIAHSTALEVYEVVSGGLMMRKSQVPTREYIFAGFIDNEHVLTIWDGIVNVLEISTGEVIAFYGLSDQSGIKSTYSLSRDGKLLGIGSRNGSTVVRDAITGIRVATIDDLGLHDGHVTALEFSPDGKLLVTGGGDKMIKIIDLETSRIIWQYKYTDSVGDLEFNQDGTKLAFCANWSASSKIGIVRLDEAGNIGAVSLKDSIIGATDLTWNPFNELDNYIITEDANNQILEWNTFQTHAPTKLGYNYGQGNFEAHVEWGTDGVVLFSKSREDVGIYDGKSRDMISFVEVAGRITDIAQSPIKSEFIAATSNGMYAYDQSGQQTREYQVWGDVNRIYIPDHVYGQASEEDIIYVASRGVWLLKLTTGEAVTWSSDDGARRLVPMEFPGPSTGKWMDFHDFHYWHDSGTDPILFAAEEYGIYVINLNDGTFSRHVESPEYNASSLDMFGSTLIFGSLTAEGCCNSGRFSNNTVTGWEIDPSKTDEIVEFALEHEFPVTQVAFLDNTKSILASSRNAVYLWSNIPSIDIIDPSIQNFDLFQYGEPVVVAKHFDNIFEFDISPDKTHIVTSSEDGEVAIWPVAQSEKKRQYIQVFPNHGGSLDPYSWHVSESPVEFIARGSSGLPVTMEVIDGPAEFIDSNLHLLGAGVVTILLNQVGSNDYYPALPRVLEINVTDDGDSHSEDDFEIKTVKFKQNEIEFAIPVGKNNIRLWAKPTLGGDWEEVLGFALMDTDQYTLISVEFSESFTPVFYRISVK